MHEFRPGAPAFTLPNAAVSTPTWKTPQIPGEGVATYGVAMTGANNDLGSITRIRVKASDQPIYDIGLGEYRSWMQRFSQKGLAPALADVNFAIPMNLLDGKGDQRYDVSFPRGREATVEFDTDGTGAAGSAVIAYEKTDVKARFYRMLFGSVMGVAGAQQNAVWRINQSAALLRAFCVTAANLTSVQLFIQGREQFLLPGSQLFNMTRGANGGTITDPVWIKLREPQPVGRDGTYLQFTTGAGWAGTEEAAVDLLVPQT